jgi:membrane protein CcdC involved in cytochrome C biogenesis
MMPQGHGSILVTLLVVALIAWRFYARIRRSIGRQRLSKWRPWVTVVVFPLVIMILAAASWRQQEALLMLGGGAIVGIVLGVVGLRMTKFEVTAKGAYYTPSAHLGIALSALLFLRIAYRFFQMSQSTDFAAPPPPASSPLTLLLVGTLALYYMTYAVGLLRWGAATSRPPEHAASRTD